MQIKILLEMETPKVGKGKKPQEPETSVEEEVRNAIELIDSGHDSHVEWRLLNKLARELRPRKDKRSKDLMEMIDPVLQKYGLHGVEEEGS